MKARTARKVRATVKAILNILDNETDWMLIPSKSETIRRLNAHQPIYFKDEFNRLYLESSIKDGVDKLLRKGRVEIRETFAGTEVKITNRGKTEIIKYQLQDLVLERPESWDGKWRLVIFDVDEAERYKRDELRRWLIKLGLRQMQKSVFIYPFLLERQIMYLREILGVPHMIKLVTAEKIDNDLDLREWFNL